MKAVLDRIDARTAQHDALPFFRRIERPGSRAALEAIYTGLCFWVFTFQDVLVLNLARATDPELRALLAAHHREDCGHQQWYVADLRALGIEPSIEWAFGPEHAVTRHRCFELMAAVLGARHDTSRVSAVVALEAAGGCIFSRMPGHVRSVGGSERLQYFSDMHFDVERSHQLHDDGLNQRLRATVVTHDARSEGLALVDAIFDAIDAMICGYEARAAHAERATDPERQAFR